MYIRLRKILSAAAVSWLLFQPIGGQSEGEQENAAQMAPVVLWTHVQSTEGKCSMKFPTQPEHISEKMNIPEEGFDLSYDAYISGTEKEDAVFMLLVAQYPDFVDETYAQMSLEGFLNGILTHNPTNQLVFADLALVNGHEALDFFIRSGATYFKGRALLVGNSLYLMAVECEMQNYDEEIYTRFVESFELLY